MYKKKKAHGLIKTMDYWFRTYYYGVTMHQFFKYLLK